MSVVLSLEWGIGRRRNVATVTSVEMSIKFAVIARIPYTGVSNYIRSNPQIVEAR